MADSRDLVGTVADGVVHYNRTQMETGVGVTPSLSPGEEMDCPLVRGRMVSPVSWYLEVYM